MVETCALFGLITKLLQCTYSKNGMKKMVMAIQQAFGKTHLSE